MHNFNCSFYRDVLEHDENLYPADMKVTPPYKEVLIEWHKVLNNAMIWA